MWLWFWGQCSALESRDNKWAELKRGRGLRRGRGFNGWGALEVWLWL